jgi:hypothetical protein
VGLSLFLFHPHAPSLGHVDIRMTEQGTMGAALSAFPNSPMRSIHHRTIAALIVQQRLLDLQPLLMRFYSARDTNPIIAHITEEVILLSIVEKP